MEPQEARKKQFTRIPPPTEMAAPTQRTAGVPNSSVLSMHQLRRETSSAADRGMEQDALKSRIYSRLPGARPTSPAAQRSSGPPNKLPPPVPTRHAPSAPAAAGPSTSGRKPLPPTPARPAQAGPGAAGPSTSSKKPLPPTPARPAQAGPGAAGPSTSGKKPLPPTPARPVQAGPGAAGAGPTGAAAPPAPAEVKKPSRFKRIGGWLKRHFGREEEEPFVISGPGEAVTQPTPQVAAPAAAPRSTAAPSADRAAPDSGVLSLMQSSAEKYQGEKALFQRGPSLERRAIKGSDAVTSAYDQMVQAYDEMERCVGDGTSPDPSGFDQLYESCSAAELAAKAMEKQLPNVSRLRRSKAAASVRTVLDAAHKRRDLLNQCSEQEIVSGLWQYRLQGRREIALTAADAAAFDSVTDQELAADNDWRSAHRRKVNHSKEQYILYKLNVQAKQIAGYAASVYSNAALYKGIIQKIDHGEPLKEDDMASLQRLLGVVEYIGAVCAQVDAYSKSYAAEEAAHMQQLDALKGQPLSEDQKRAQRAKSEELAGMGDSISELTNYTLGPSGKSIWLVLEDALDLPGTIDLNQQSLEPFRSDAVPNALRAKIQAGTALGALQPQKDGKPTAMEKFNASMRDRMQPGAGQLSPAQVKLLMESMDEPENVHQARIVAESVERETEQLLASAFHGKALSVQKPSGSGSVDFTPAQVIGDYTASSAAFRDLANGVSNDPSTRIKQQAMDKLLSQMHNADGGKPRVTYRYTAYDDQSQCPYDEKSASRIQVGDLITDPNFVSTSAGKQFIQGREATSLKPAQVNMVIYGSSGVPIATQAGSYSNQAKLSAQKDDTGLAGAASGKVQGAGQSEVLYPRNTVFKVLAIDKTQDSGRVIYKVALSEVPAGQVTGKAKNSYTGS